MILPLTKMIKFNYLRCSRRVKLQKNFIFKFLIDFKYLNLFYTIQELPSFMQCSPILALLSLRANF